MIELKDIINNLLERRGRFQTILIILVCLNSIQIGINHTITSFHTYTPSYVCLSDNTIGCGNATVKCSGGYKFNETDDQTIVTEWNLVCDKSFIPPLTNTLYFVGVTVGALVCGTLADLWGRKLLVWACMYLQAILSIGVALNKDLYVFMILRIMQGFFIQGLQNCSYTLMLEYCPSHLRTLAAVFWELNWAVGLGILGITSYFVKSWRTLTLILITPTILSFSYFWIFPESITWLYANGKYGQALRLTRIIAKKNQDDDILDECDKVVLDDMIVEKSLVQSTKSTNAIENTADNDVKDLDDLEKFTDENKTKKQSSLLDIVQNVILRKHLIIMICVWFSVTLSYYGVLFFLQKLPGQRHMNFLIGAVIEALAYILAYFILSRFGRRIPMTAYQCINGILCICMAFLSLAGDSQKWLLIGIALIAKGLAVSSFCGMFIYCSELFPTICRGIALGLCGFAARCGSLLAPQFIHMTTLMPTYIPMCIIAILILITGFATTFLPETLSSRLPSTVEEANELWGKKVSE